MSHHEDTISLLRSLGIKHGTSLGNPDDDGKLGFLMGTIPSSYTSGLPTITFDGESTTSSRLWPHLSSYTPAANDRVFVLILNRGTSGLILGKIVSS